MRRTIKWAAMLFLALAAVAGLSVRLQRLPKLPVSRDPAVAAAYAAPPDVPDGPRRPQRPPRPGEVREMTIRRLGDFNYVRLGKIPDDVRALDGMAVRLRGYVVPTNQAVGQTQFVLVPTLGSCCFGQPPGIEHIVMVDCAAGHPVDAPPAAEVLVKGTLRVGEVVQDDNIIALYRVTDASVKPMVR